MCSSLVLNYFKTFHRFLWNFNKHVYLEIIVKLDSPTDRIYIYIYIYSINDTASEQIKEIFLRGFSYRQKLNNSIPYNLILESE